MADFDKKYNIVDEPTPRHSLLSAHYKKSFAYYTLRERLPVILTQVIDNLSREKDQIAEEYGEQAREELKEIVGNISKLKYQLQTDKSLTEFDGKAPDIAMWNNFIKSLEQDRNSYFTTCWLYAECYMYRRLRSFFEISSSLHSLDYFRKQKENALTCCLDTLEGVILGVRNYNVDDNLSGCFNHLLKLNLWGNRCDLSISEGQEIKHTGDPFSAIDSLDENILIDDTQHIWNCISSAPGKNVIVEFVNDNGGYELFTDFLMAEFLIDHKLASKIRFNVKAIPWFISDVTPSDFHWTLDYLKHHDSDVLRSVGEKWSSLLKNGYFELHDVDYFWTGPHEFYKMKDVATSLYNKLADAKLIIFKGDLNYRKLLGDFSWDSTEDFQTCLRGFQPTNLCTLRTVKADLICGLQEGVAEALNQKDPNWMTTGEYGVIQFNAKN